MAKISFHPAITQDVNVNSTLRFGEPFIQQVQDILRQAGPALQSADEVTLVGQGVAAILMVAGMEMLRGLPTLTLYGFVERQVKEMGTLSLSDYRHQAVRARRNEIPEGEAFTGYSVVDGSGRGLTPDQMNELAVALNTSPENIRVLNADVGQVDFANPTVGLVEKLLACGLTKADWAARRVIYLPAGAGLAAAIQATAMHGLSESWPLTIRLNAGADKAFHVEEIVDPQAMRQWGAQLRGEWASDQTVQLAERLVRELLESNFPAKLENGILTVGDYKVAVSSITLNK